LPRLPLTGGLAGLLATALRDGAALAAFADLPGLADLVSLPGLAGLLDLAEVAALRASEARVAAGFADDRGAAARAAGF
jgi:hypothetical protein